MTLSHGAVEFGLVTLWQSFCLVITAVLSKLKLTRGPVHIKLFVQVTQLEGAGAGQAVSMRSSEGGEMLSSSVIDDVRLPLRAPN